MTAGWYRVGLARSSCLHLVAGTIASELQASVDPLDIGRFTFWYSAAQRLVDSVVLEAAFRVLADGEAADSARGLAYLLAGDMIRLSQSPDVERRGVGFAVDSTGRCVPVQERDILLVLLSHGYVATATTLPVSSGERLRATVEATAADSRTSAHLRHFLGYC
jgi:hypothetical protein